MTVHKLSYGDGYLYYTGEVASGDALRSKDRKLGDYYTLEGLPPGQWVGSSAHELGVSGNVTEEQMHMLFSGKAKPMTPEFYAEAFDSAHVAGEFERIRVMEEERVRYAEENWQILHGLRSETPQWRIGKVVGLTREGVKQRKKSLKITNSVKPYTGQAPSPEQAKADIIANYKMTPAQKKAAESKAQQAADKARAEWVKKHGLNNVDNVYQLPDPAFAQAVQRQVDKHKKDHDSEPTKAQMREYRLKVAGEFFRNENGYEPEKEELVRYMQRLEKPAQQSIAGYDLVFSPTKSVSIAWGLGNKKLRKGIEEAHEQAIQDVLSYIENRALYTRRGKGGIEQIDVDGGLIGTKFRHYDSREGDPNLHDHTVIVNRVKGADGKWSSIDGRNIYGYGVSASELYNTRIAQHIHQNLGLEFVAVERKGKFIYELAGIEDDAIRAFSSRRGKIEKEFKKARKQFIKDHGYEPNNKQTKALYQQVTLSTRPEKLEAKSLKDLNNLWTAKAKSLKGVKLPTGDKLEKHLKKASNKQAKKVLEGQAEVLATSPEEHAQKIISRLEDSRATWSDRHVEAEAHRYFRELTSGSFVDDETFQSAVSAVIASSLSMRPADTMEVPEAKRRKDGTSFFTRAGSQVYTSHKVIQAEKNLLAAAMNDALAPAEAATFEQQLAEHLKDNQVSDAQENMARVFSTSSKRLVVGIGPAGAGKTTSTVLTVKTVQAQGRKVIGLAPTAAAAAVMSKELGIEATTIDRFLHPGDDTKSKVRAGDVLLVDEIGMVATPKLAHLLDLSYESGSVIRGMGDPQQLSAVGAGGALRLIEREAGAVYLEDVFRFRNADGSTNLEEANASMLLREPPVNGADKPFQFYLEQGRILAGEADTMLAKVFEAWAADTEAGKDSLMLAGNNEAVQKLNEMAQVQAIVQGKVREKGRSVFLHNNGTAYKGDVIVTRKNDRQNRTRGSKDFVKNGDLWTVQSIRRDGSMVVKHLKHQGKVVLPAEYVAKNVELGYAATIHRAQGATVDTVHAYVDKGTDRAGAYVGLTRGRFSNRIYVATDAENSRDDVLEAIAQNYDTNLSVHEEAERIRQESRDVATRVAIYDSLAEHSMQVSYATMLRKELGESAANELIESSGYGAMCHELDRIYKAGLDPTQAIRDTYYSRDLHDAEDKGAVMQWRLKATFEHNERLLDQRATRPLGAYSDETLAKMIARAEAALPQKVDEAKLEDPKWKDRPYALVKTDKLQEMRVKTFALLRSREDAKDPHIDELRENAYAMDAEWVRRAHMSKEQKALEQFVRGEKRKDHLFTIVQALKSEQKLRATSLDALSQIDYQQQPKDKVRAGVSNHTVDPMWATNPLVTPEMRKILGVHRKEIGQLIELRGKQLADEKPEWTKALGEVPAYKPLAERWYRVAGELEAYRNQYQIPAGEPTAIPKEYLESERGQYLQAQVADLHKRSRLASHLLSAETSAQVAQAAEDVQADREIPSEVEYVLKVDNREEKIAHFEAKEQQLAGQMKAASAEAAQLRAEVKDLAAEIQRLEPIRQEAHIEHVQARSAAVRSAGKAYQQVKDAEKAKDAAGFFGRGKATRALEEASEAFAQAHGGSKDMQEVRDKWVPVQPAVVQARQKLEQLDGQLDEVRQKHKQATERIELLDKKRLKAQREHREAKQQVLKLKQTTEHLARRRRAAALGAEAAEARRKATNRDFAQPNQRVR